MMDDIALDPFDAKDIALDPPNCVEDNIAFDPADGEDDVPPPVPVPAPRPLKKHGPWI